MKVVIIGGVAAGAKVAAKTHRLLPDAKIDIYTDDTHVSYSSCGLPYYIQGNFQDFRTLLVRSPEEFKKQGTDVHLLHKAIKILPEKRQVLIHNIREDKAFLADYDKLVIATGARPYIPPIINANLGNIFTVRKIEDGINIREKALQSGCVVIIGGGYIGIELLESFVELGLHVTLIEAAETVMPVFDTEISELIKSQLESISKGRFDILTSEIVTEFTSNAKGEVKSVKTCSGKEILTDFVIICSGVRPNVEFAAEAGIQLGETGAIRVNKHMRTNIPDIYACGDCAEKTLMLTGTKIWVPLGSTANKEGRVAALSLSGYDEVFDGILGSAVVRCLSFSMSMTGLTERMANNLGFNPISVTVTKYDKVGYMPDVNNITLKLIAEKTTGLLLGGQAVGAGDSDKRINTLTTALLGRLTVEDFAKNDITYAPPFAPTIDPLLNAAELLLDKYHKLQ